MNFPNLRTLFTRFRRTPQLATSLSEALGSTDDQGMTFIGEASELHTVRPGDTAIILGELVIMSLDTAPDEGIGASPFIAQPLRESRRKDRSLKRWVNARPVQIHIGIHQQLALHIEANSTRATRYVLAVDAMQRLADSYPHNATLLICNGYHTHELTYFDTYLFQNRQLIQVGENTLKENTSPRYPTQVAEQIRKAIADYPEAQILWTAPLTPIAIPGFNDIQRIGHDIYKHKFPTVTHDGQTAPPSPKLPATATAAVILGCLAYGAADVVTMHNKRTTYDSLTRQSTTTPSAPLEILQARAQWHQNLSRTPAEAQLQPTKQLLAAVAQMPELRIESLDTATQRIQETPAQPTSETAPIAIIVSTAYQPNVGIIDQTQPLIARLTKLSGLSLNVPTKAMPTPSQDGRLNITILAEAK